MKEYKCSFIIRLSGSKRACEIFLASQPEEAEFGSIVREGTDKKYKIEISGRAKKNFDYIGSEGFIDIDLDQNIEEETLAELSEIDLRSKSKILNCLIEIYQNDIETKAESFNRYENGENIFEDVRKYDPRLEDGYEYVWNIHEYPTFGYYTEYEEIDTELIKKDMFSEPDDDGNRYYVVEGDISPFKPIWKIEMRKK